MGGMRIDPKELPLPLREQVAVKVVAQLAQANPVAGKQKKRTTGRIRRLRFRRTYAAKRYLQLREIIRHSDGIVYDLALQKDGEGYICSFTYTIREDW